MNTYIISCRQTPDRGELCAALMKERGISFRFWDGIHAQTFGLRTVLPNKLGDSYIIQPGQVGCMLSHYTLWQALLLQGDESAIIMEDDAVPNENFGLALNYELRRLPGDWQFLYIGHLGIATPGQYPSPYGFEAVKLEKQYPHGTHCYAVTRSALELLVKTNHQARTHVDIQIGENTLPYLNVYGFNPSLAGQRKGWPSMSQDTHATVSAGTPKTCPVSPHTDGDAAILDRVAKEAIKAHGWCDDTKLRQLATLVLTRKPKLIVEIGVFGGRSLMAFAIPAKEIGGCRVVGIDAWANAPALEGCVEKANADYWGKLDLEQVKETCDYHLFRLKLTNDVELIQASAHEVADRFAAESIDILHLDGNHAAGPAMREAQQWYPKVTKGGVIICDDVGWMEGGQNTVLPTIKWMIAQGAEMVEDIGNCAILQKGK